MTESLQCAHRLCAACLATTRVYEPVPVCPFCRHEMSPQMTEAEILDLTGMLVAEVGAHVGSPLSAQEFVELTEVVLTELEAQVGLQIYYISCRTKSSLGFLLRLGLLFLGLRFLGLLFLGLPRLGARSFLSTISASPDKKRRLVAFP